MPGLLIVAHSPLASALRSVAAHVDPDGASALQTVDVEASWGADEVEQAVRAAVARHGQPQTLILTDVFGATPHNVAQRLADGGAVRVVSGVNVPMLWRVLCYAKDPLETLVARAVAGGSQGVMQLAVSRPQTQAPDPTKTHDPKYAHHQQ